MTNYTFDLPDRNRDQLVNAHRYKPELNDHLQYHISIIPDGHTCFQSALSMDFSSQIRVEWCEANCCYAWKTLVRWTLADGRYEYEGLLFVFDNVFDFRRFRLQFVEYTGEEGFRRAAGWL